MRTYLIPVRFVYAMSECRKRYERAPHIFIQHPAPGPHLPRRE